MHGNVAMITIELTHEQARALEGLLNNLLINRMASLSWLTEVGASQGIDYPAALRVLADTLLVKLYEGEEE